MINAHCENPSDDLKNLIREIAILLRHWYEYDWFENVNYELHDNIEKDVVSPIINKICDKLGHDIHIDTCGIPAHDYCVLCGNPFPGQGVERTKK